MLEVTAPRRSVIDLTGGVTEAVDVPPLTEVEPLDPDWLAALQARCLSGVIERAGEVG